MGCCKRRKRNQKRAWGKTEKVDASGADMEGVYKCEINSRKSVPELQRKDSDKRW